MPFFIVTRTITLFVQFVLFFSGPFWFASDFRSEGVRWMFAASCTCLALLSAWNKGIAFGFLASVTDAAFIQSMLDVTPLSFANIQIGKYALISGVYCVFMVVFMGVLVYALSGATYGIRWILSAQAVAWLSIVLTVACSHAKFPWYSTLWEYHPWMIGAVLTVGLNALLFSVVRKRRWEDPDSIGGGCTPERLSEGEAEIPYGSSLGR